MPDYNQQRVGAPYGNVFFVETPTLDRVGQQIYADEQRREQIRLQQNQKLDDEFARNLSGIRDADIGDVTKAYGDYKLAYQNSMRKKNGVSPEEQLEILRKKAAIYDVINKSKQEKEWEDGQQKLGNVNKGGMYADEWQDILYKRRQTPYKNINREDDKKLYYDFSVPDFDKYNKEAIGTLTREVRGKTTENGLNDETPVYKVGNNSIQIYDSLLDKAVSKNQGRKMTGLINNSFGSAQEKEDLMNKYFAKVNSPEYIAAYGEPKPFPQSAQTELGNAIMLQTMRNVVDAPIPTAKIEVKLNPDRNMKARNDRQDERDKRMQGWKEYNIRLARWLSDLTKDNAVPFDLTTYTKTADGQYDITEPLKGVSVNRLKNGTSFTSPSVLYNPSTGNFQYLDPIEKKVVIKPFTQFIQDIKTNNPNIDVKFLQTLGNPVDRRSGTNPRTGKPTGENTNTTKEKFPLPKGQPRTVNQGGFTYTWNPNTGKYE